MTPVSRQQEIKTIHKKYQDFYRIGGGLFIIFILILIGSWIFGQNQFEFPDNMLGYVTNVATEALSVIATIIVIDQLNRRRERNERKLSLFRQAKSRSNDVAIEALEQILHEGWQEDMLKHYIIKDDGRIKLSQVQWAGGVDFRKANLQQASLSLANLPNINLTGANLQNASLWLTNLRGAHLLSVNLQEAQLENTYLDGSILWQAQLKGAKLDGAKFDENTVLPDAQFVGFDEGGNLLFDKYWTSETDMSRYTDPNHPNFWQPSDNK